MVKSLPRYYVLAAGTSLLMPFVCFLSLWLISNILYIFGVYSFVFYLLALIPPLVLGIVAGRKANLPSTLFHRYLPLLLPLLLTILALTIPILAFRLSYYGLEIVLALGILGLYALLLLGFILGSWRKPASRRARGMGQLLAILGICLLIPGMTWHYEFRDTLFGKGREASVGHGINTYAHTRFHSKDVVQLDEPATLQIIEAYPILDGAVAVLPLYSAAARVVYADIDKETWNTVVTFTNTPSAYKRLAQGKVDIFFGAGPSEEQLAYGAEQGVEFTITPLGREAFVFLVHKDNPVHSLSQEEIRAIYSGHITSWAQVGGAHQPILAFQRPQGSGSQTAMEEMVMGGMSLREPIQEEYLYGMGDIIREVAAYRNRFNALGYSFRWYATVQYTHPDIRLLAVDGIVPTSTTIADGSYPFTMEIVAVTASPRTPNQEAIINWLLGPQGQILVEQAGYVPLSQ